jgi:hypothetical protein
VLKRGTGTCKHPHAGTGKALSLALSSSSFSPSSSPSSSSSSSSSSSFSHLCGHDGKEAALGAVADAEKLKAGNIRKARRKVRLDSSRVPCLRQNVPQLAVREEIEARKRSALGMQEVVQAQGEACQARAADLKGLQQASLTTCG